MKLGTVVMKYCYFSESEIFMEFPWRKVRALVFSIPKRGNQGMDIWICNLQSRAASRFVAFWCRFGTSCTTLLIQMLYQKAVIELYIAASRFVVGVFLSLCLMW